MRAAAPRLAWLSCSRLRSGWRWPSRRVAARTPLLVLLALLVVPTSALAQATPSVHTSGTFANGSSTVDFSDGSVTVNSVTVSSGTSLTANITVGDDASLGLHNVSVTTGSEQATEFVPGPLTVVSSAAALGGGPSIASISPTLGALGQTLDVAIVGQNTSFADGVSTASFSGSGITVQSTQVTDATHAPIRRFRTFALSKSEVALSKREVSGIRRRYTFNVWCSVLALRSRST